MRDDGNGLGLGGGGHGAVGVADPGSNNRVFDQGVGGDDMDGLRAGFGGQVAEGQPDQLQDGGGVLAPAVADDPGDVVGLV